MNGFEKGRAWIELDRAALQHNVEILRRQLSGGCELMPAVKANAYGHGAVLMAKELNSMGIHAFCVASVGEGVELREAGVQGSILVLGYTHPDYFSLLRSNDLIQTVVDYEYARILNRYGEPLHVHIAVDTGMHRLGVDCREIHKIFEIIAMKNLTIEGIYTHLCAADSPCEEHRRFSLSQNEAFWSLVEALKQQGVSCEKKHIMGSYGLINYPECKGDYARVGIALYGVLSTKNDTENCGLDLRPVLSLKARVSSVRPLHRGEGAGYGLVFIAEDDMRIAVLSIGYADGLPRSLSGGRGSVFLHGKKAPIIGRVCMDQTLVDASAVPELKTGDIAVIIGSAGDGSVSACDVAGQADTIANEVLCHLGSRLERFMK